MAGGIVLGDADVLEVDASVRFKGGTFTSGACGVVKLAGGNVVGKIVGTDVLEVLGFSVITERSNHRFPSDSGGRSSCTCSGTKTTCGDSSDTIRVTSPSNGVTLIKLTKPE